MSCDGLDDLYQNFVVKGTYSCQTLNDQANLTRSASSPSSSSSGGAIPANSTASGNPDTAPSGLSKGERAGIGVGVGLGVGIFFGVLGFLYQRWHLKRQGRKKEESVRAAS